MTEAQEKLCAELESPTHDPGVDYLTMQEAAIEIRYLAARVEALERGENNDSKA